MFAFLLLTRGGGGVRPSSPPIRFPDFEVGDPPVVPWTIYAWIVLVVLGLWLLPVLWRLVEHAVRSMSRFYGYRRLLFGIVGLLVAVLLSLVPSILLFSHPHLLPSDSIVVMNGFCRGFLLVGLGLGWLWLSPRPQVHWPASRPLEALRITVGGVCFATAAVQLTTATISLQRAADATSGWMVALAGVPTIAGIWIGLWPELVERVFAHPTVHRQFVRGPEPNEAFAGPLAVARLSQPIATRRVGPEGLLLNGRYLGRTLFEHNYRRRHIIQPFTGHSYTLASTGAGKLVTGISNLACTVPGSAILCSNKPQLADMFCGRRQDPRLFDGSRPHGFRSGGIDVRGISRAKFHLRGGRCYLIDPSGESIYHCSGHQLTSEVDVTRDDAAPILKAIGQSIVIINRKVNEPFFGDAARIYLAGIMADSLTRYREPARRTIPAIVDRAMGMDSEGRCDPDVLKKTLIEMASNNCLGGMAQSAAHLMLNAGERTRGSIIAQLQTAVAWVLDPQMRKYLCQPSEFSYREVGVDDLHPVTVFLISRPIAEDEAKPLLRMHLETAMTIFRTRKQRAAHGIWVCLDEFRSYGGPDMESICKAFTVAREAKIFLDIYAQSFPSLVQTIGESAAAEIEACGSASIYGVADIETAERVSRILGSRTMARSTNGGSRTCPLMTPQDVLRDMRKTSNLMLSIPDCAPPMLLERMGFKSIRTQEGAVFKGLPLSGHYDDGLSRYSNA